MSGAHFLHFAVTPAVAKAQEEYYGWTHEAPPLPGVGPSLGEEEKAFISARDTFYLSTVSETGWPYVQHRGGPRGFLQVVGPSTLAFADLRGNRQLLTTGNLSSNTRVALLLMDYPSRMRLKLLGHATVLRADAAPELAARLPVPPRSLVERLVRIDVVAFDWNCPKYITPRYTAEEIETLLTPLRRRIAELEEALRVARPSR
ncbi:MAG: pyridoxamine 5'-phosphate oxidase family protein [Opitutaceae bacterium]|nr:pyridoxamine 5'-phosphate oxidase family protein [Opitutaceae bacterium]